jgi:hypothetical protein
MDWTGTCVAATRAVIPKQEKKKDLSPWLLVRTSIFAAWQPPPSGLKMLPGSPAGTYHSPMARQATEP